MFSKAKERSDKRGTSVNVKTGVPSIVSPNLRIVGDLTSDGDVQIDGTVEGNVRSRALTVGRTGSVNGEIVVESIHLSGTVTGPVTARTAVLSNTAHLKGDLVYERLTLEPGAKLDGHCRPAEAETGTGEGERVIKEVVSEPREGGATKAPVGTHGSDIKTAAPGRRWPAQ